jgi:hypothetical protein
LNVLNKSANTMAARTGKKRSMLLLLCLHREYEPVDGHDA